MKHANRNTFSGLLIVLFIVFGCTKPEGPESWSGEELAQAYCASCHVYPEPALLPKSSWEVVLPMMGARLGIQSESYDPFEDMSMDEKFFLQSEMIFPASPVLSEKAWKRLTSFILENAPDSIGRTNAPIWDSQSIFSAKFPETGNQPPTTTMVEIDAANNTLYAADWGGGFYRLNSDFVTKESVKLPNPIIDVDLTDAETNLLSIGRLYPNDLKSGAVVSLQEGKYDKQDLLFANLGRPVNFTYGDLDNDGLSDFVVCGFGNYTGKLSWFKNTGNGFVEEAIRETPGATRVFLEDVDGNGFTDLIVAFAQGDEGVSVFYNEEGVFRESKVLRFHPLYGIYDMEYIDFDGDGDKDIVLSNGDNGDHTNILKYYHGIRIFLNDGTHRFSETYFFPYYGSSKVRCADFDMDGDVDIVASSFFPDFQQSPSQSIVYLENQGNWNFVPNYVEGAGEGRWMVMDSGDLDGDGDVDIVVGSFTLDSEGIDPETRTRWRSEGKAFLYLENQTLP